MSISLLGRSIGRIEWYRIGWIGWISRIYTFEFVGGGGGGLVSFLSLTVLFPSLKSILDFLSCFFLVVGGRERSTATSSNLLIAEGRGRKDLFLVPFFFSLSLSRGAMAIVGKRVSIFCLDLWMREIDGLDNCIHRK